MIGNPSVVRNDGYRALINVLGAARTAMFLRQLENGIGNYTEDRRNILDNNSVDEIAERIKKRKADK